MAFLQNLGIPESYSTAAAPKMAAVPITIEKVPTFGQTPGHFPQRGLVFSCLVHAAMFAVLPTLFPALNLVEQSSRQLILLAPDETSAHLTLPALGDIGALTGSSSSEGPSGVSHASSSAPPLPRGIAKYKGPQEILSDPANATNDQQTIRRPDIDKPMKIKAPVRARSVVQIPMPPKVKFSNKLPEFLAHAMSTAIPVKAEITSNAPPPPKDPVLVVRRSEARPKIVDAPPPSVMPDAKSAPNLSSPTGNAPVLAKAIVIVNAVEPAAPAPAIPEGEISGRFSVAPMTVTVSGPPSGGSPHGTTDGAGRNGTAAGPGLAENAGFGNGGPGKGGGGTGSGTHGAGSGASGVGEGSGGVAGSGNGNGSGTGTGTGRGAGAGASLHGGSAGAGGGGVGTGGSMRGLSIAGGVGNGNGGGLSASGAPHSYHLTIVAAGSNGGATRDVGVFSQDEAVYTVSLSMRTAGGGPAWSMQYSLPTVTGVKGALTPPFAVKQVAATFHETLRDHGAVFIAGEINADGKLQSLHAARVSDTRSAAAIAALAQWEFTPAKLDGNAVPAKVLIGVVLNDAKPVKR